jgi:uracil-DNA glycosylase
MMQSHTGPSLADLTPTEAAAALDWLLDMGADEILLEAPVNRLAIPIAIEPLTEKTLRQLHRPQLLQQAVPQPSPAPSWKATAPPDDLQATAEALAAQCWTLADLQTALSRFDTHPLKKTAGNLCFASGAHQSRILVLCDRPRTEEDRSGEVLAGKHQVLAERMFAAIDLCGVEACDGAEQVLLANVIPWRPPGNRAPTELETNLCLPFIRRLIAILQPQIILCFSALPGQLLAGGEESIPKARGKWLFAISGDLRIPLITTFHPETLLKSSGSKRLAWHDLLAFRERLDTL